MSKTINVGQPLFNNIEGHPFVLGPQGPYRTKEEAIQALIQFYETRDDIPNGQECIIAGVKFIWRGNDLYESLAVKTINESQTDLNFYRTPGTYRFNGIRNNNFANLPINNNNPDASITGELVVYSSVEGTTTYRSIIGQVLFLSNAEGHETKIYTRSANKTSKDGGATYEVTWGDWQVCQGMKEVGLVDSYDSFIDNGMYSGIYNNSGIIETFVIITVNDCIVKSQFNQPKSVSQLKYALNAVTNKSELSIRVGGGQTFAWGEWKPIFDAESITTQINNIQNQLNDLTEGTTGNINDIVNKAVNDIVGGAPEAYDTLKEIVDYINQNKDEVTGQVNDIVTAINELQNQNKVLDEKINTKQPTLVPGENIKNINNQSILGEGNIEIKPGITEEEKKELNDKIDDKAPKVGYAPDLKVNFAKELFGRGEATPEVIGGIRPTGVRSIGDGNATIEKIRGNSVVWNQLVNHSHWKSTTNNGVTFTVEDNGKIVVNGTATGVARIMVNPYFGLKANHKYALTGSPKDSNGAVLKYFGTGLRDEGNGSILTITTDNFNALAIEVAKGLSVNNAIFYPQLTDLTLMFGAGNEPTTIEEFEARKPLNVSNEYNEGTIVSYNGDALKSVGFNAWDEEWEVGAIAFASGNLAEVTNRIRSKNYCRCLPNKGYCNPSKQNVCFYDEDLKYIAYAPFVEFKTPNNAYWFKLASNADYGNTYKGDICIHLAHTYTPERYPNGYAPYEANTHLLPNVTSILDADGNQLFPNGLLSAGSVHDEITATKAVKRVGVVDMGTLDWANFKHGFTTYSIRPASGSGKGKNLICAKYPTYTPEEIYNNDAIVGIAGPQSGYWGGLFLADSKYSTGAELKAAMSGVLLYYELAEPIEVDLPEPLNMTYEAWDFGTEELLAEGATTPLNADIVYQFNAVDRIRENSSAIDALENHVEERKDDGIELLTNGNLKLTLKGETREFMPATPSGDPMHYAYVSAGAEYNATDDFILKDAPWKDMVDTIEDKAKWGFDVVDASEVKQMTIGNTTYNYVQTTRQSPEGTTEPRYFLVGQASDGTWVEDETKVLHLPGHWYLNGIGDITGKEISLCYTQTMPYYTTNVLTKAFRRQTNLDDITLQYRTTFRNLRQLSTLISPIDCESVCYGNFYIETFVMTFFPEKTTVQVSGLGNAFYNAVNMKHLIGQLISATKIKTDQSMKVLSIILMYTADFTKSRYISKPSILYSIKNANPTTPITITLHADRYAQLAEDADIIAALEAKNAALEGTGGSISLVSA